MTLSPLVQRVKEASDSEDTLLLARLALELSAALQEIQSQRWGQDDLLRMVDGIRGGSASVEQLVYWLREQADLADTSRRFASNEMSATLHRDRMAALLQSAAALEASLRETQELAKKIEDYGNTPFPAAPQWIVRELHRISGELFCNGTIPMEEAKAMARKVDNVIEALKPKQDADYQAYIEANRTLVESPEEIARFRNSAEKMQAFNVIRLLDSHEAQRAALEKSRRETQEAREIARAYAGDTLDTYVQQILASWSRETDTGESQS